MRAPTARWQRLIVAAGGSEEETTIVDAPEMRARGPGQVSGRAPICSDSFLTCALLLLFFCKFDGDHWRLGVSPEGFELALKLLKWDEYVRDESATSPFRDQSSGTMWNSGDKNGWDLCHLMRLYMERIGKTHLSFAEAVMEGEVEELVPLRREVGVADAVSDDELYERVYRITGS